MKKHKNILLMLVIFLALASCKKNMEITEETPKMPTKFSEIKTDPSFNWSTTRNVEVKLTGLSTAMPISNTLLLSNKDKDAIYYTGNHVMSENLVITITVPTAQDSMVLNFGSIQKTYSIKQGAVDVDYVISYPEE